MVHPVDAVVAIIFSSGFLTIIGVIICCLAFYFFITPAIPAIAKLLARIRQTDEKKERKEEAKTTPHQLFMGKTLEIDFDGKSIHKAKKGIITGWSAWKPKYIDVENKYDKEFNINSKNFKRDKPPILHILTYDPFVKGFIEGIFGKTCFLMFDPNKQIKNITNKKVILQGDSIEPYAGGYPLLTSVNTPVQEIAYAMSFQKAMTILDSSANNLRKISENALNINPFERAALEQGSPKITVPAPKPQQEPNQT